jgi:hypothetical protein
MLGSYVQASMTQSYPYISTGADQTIETKQE